MEGFGSCNINHFVVQTAVGLLGKNLVVERNYGIVYLPILVGCGGKGFAGLGYVWGVLQTFTFITFTRLFFRSGSNLDPATANEVAWQTARRMVHQIGSGWDWSLVPQICANYWRVFALVILGMVIHWLPVRWKRWYRINFALLPLPVMALVVVAVVFIVYQFITADLQAFIYFQF